MLAEGVFKDVSPIMSPAVDDDSVIWDVGVFDAHCHPTDIMDTVRKIADMQAQLLTVMASRREDQHLVVNMAQQYPLERKEDFDDRSAKRVIPAFGWHPWFSHQMVDDRDSTGMDEDIDRIKHYTSVLTPVPENDENFLNAIPEPLSLSRYLQETAERLEQFPFALVGEIGLDRAFRLPRAAFHPPDSEEAAEPDRTGVASEGYTPGSREGRSLTPYRVSLDHQKTVLRAQFELAGKYQRPVSVHSVQTHGAIFDLLQEMWKGQERPSKRQRKKGQSNAPAPEMAERSNGNAGIVLSSSPFPPRICMHSYSGPPDALKQYLASTVPADVYFSFSICINFSTVAAAKAESVIKALPDDRILVESDFHCAGEKMDRLLKEIVVKICGLRGWALEQGARQLKDNWERFVFG